MALRTVVPDVVLKVKEGEKGREGWEGEGRLNARCSGRELVKSLHGLKSCNALAHTHTSLS